MPPRKLAASSGVKNGLESLWTECWEHAGCAVAWREGFCVMDSISELKLLEAGPAPALPPSAPIGWLPCDALHSSNHAGGHGPKAPKADIFRVTSAALCCRLTSSQARYGGAEPQKRIPGCILDRGLNVIWRRVFPEDVGSNKVTGCSPEMSRWPLKPFGTPWSRCLEPDLFLTLCSASHLRCRSLQNVGLRTNDGVSTSLAEAEIELGNLWGFGVWIRRLSFCHALRFGSGA